MRITCAATARGIIIPLAVTTALCVAAPAASAQGLGVGGRLAWVTADTAADGDRVRYAGGHLRLTSARIGLELSMDRRSETFEDLGQKVTDTPVQASLLLPFGGRSVSPYLLGGPGWYRREVAPTDDTSGEAVRTTEFGWHAGAGLEIRPARRFGLHADYRYTFLDFSDEDDADDGFIRNLLPGHRGSMWTLGATIYF